MIGLQNFDVGRMILMTAARDTAATPMLRSARVTRAVMGNGRMMRVQVARKTGSHGAEKRHENLEHRLDTCLHLTHLNSNDLCGWPQSPIGGAAYVLHLSGAGGVSRPR